MSSERFFGMTEKRAAFLKLVRSVAKDNDMTEEQMLNYIIAAIVTPLNKKKPGKKL